MLGVQQQLAMKNCEKGRNCVPKVDEEKVPSQKGGKGDYFAASCVFEELEKDKG